MRLRAAALGVLGALAASLATLDIAHGQERSRHALGEFEWLDKIRINVNRPTEGAFLGCSQEPQTERARDVYDAYRAAVARAAAGKRRP